MGNVTKTAPVGIDVNIQKLQTSVYNYLLSEWELTADQYTSYGRVYKNQLDNGFVAEAYMGSNEYKEVYLDDKVLVTSFIGKGESETISNDSNKANIFIVFMLNVSAIKSDVTHRADAEIAVDIQNALLLSPFVTITESATGVDNVLKEYTGTRKDMGLKYRDMQPYLFLRFNMTMSYDPNACATFKTNI